MIHPHELFFSKRQILISLPRRRLVAQRLKALEDENRRLKLLVAELSLHGEALKGVIRKNGWSLPV